MHHHRKCDQRALVGDGLECGLGEIAVVGVGDEPRELANEALLVELRQPDLVSDVDVESASARQRIKYELLADVVVRDGYELDLDARGRGELSGVGAVEGVVGRPGLHPDCDLSGCGQRTSHEGRGEDRPDCGCRSRPEQRASRPVRRHVFPPRFQGPLLSPIAKPIAARSQGATPAGPARPCAPSPPR